MIAGRVKPLFSVDMMIMYTTLFKPLDLLSHLKFMTVIKIHKQMMFRTVGLNECSMSQALVLMGGGGWFE